MAFLQKKNNTTSTINMGGGLSAGATSLTVTNGSVFPSTGDFMITLWDSSYGRPTLDSGMEICRATARSTNVLTIVRGQEGTTGVSHSNGENVDMIITAGTLNEAFDQNLKTSDTVTFDSIIESTPTLLKLDQTTSPQTIDTGSGCGISFSAFDILPATPGNAVLPVINFSNSNVVGLPMNVGGFEDAIGVFSSNGGNTPSLFLVQSGASDYLSTIVQDGTSLKFNTGSSGAYASLEAITVGGVTYPAWSAHSSDNSISSAIFQDSIAIIGSTPGMIFLDTDTGYASILSMTEDIDGSSSMSFTGSITLTKGNNGAGVVSTLNLDRSILGVNYPDDGTRISFGLRYDDGGFLNLGSPFTGGYIDVVVVDTGETTYCSKMSLGTMAAGGSLLEGIGIDENQWLSISQGIRTDLSNDLHIDCGTDKTVVLDVAVYDDVRVNTGNITRPGGSDPAWASVQPSGSGTATYLLEFAKNNYGTFVVQLPHSYKEGEDINVHVHWTPGNRGNEENGAAVGWKIDYTWANIGGSFGAISTLDLSDTCDGTDWKHQMTSDVVITGTSKNISSMLICNIRRVDTGADDTWAGTASGQLPLLLEVDFHFPIDTMGSRTMISK